MMKEIIKPIVVLAAICLLVTAVLAFVNIETRPIILAAEEKAATEARSEVLKEANSFSKVENVSLPEGVLEVYEGSNGTGYTVTAQAKGYGGYIKIICGIRPDGTIEAVKTLSHGETSGIGSRVADNGSGYREGYKGKTVNDYNTVDGVSGATISSKAYKKAVGLALKAFSVVGGNGK